MIDASEYCRKLESYLCQKNEGHLIRISGPVFDQVRGWATMGVPLAVAFRGIDQYCERYYAKGPKRRPVRVEFCEGDILELFDDWRRAVGLPSQGTREGGRQDRESLPAHMERVTTRLTACRGGRRFPAALDALIEAITRELDRERARAKHARGEDRAQLVARLAELDRLMMATVMRELPSDARTSYELSAAEEITPFASRMTPDARTTAVESALERLVREGFGLPTLTFE